MILNRNTLVKEIAVLVPVHINLNTLLLHILQL